MNQSKNAIGNLINRYRAVLKKCHLLNTFGSLAVVGMLVMGGGGFAVGMAPGLAYGATAPPESYTILDNVEGTSNDYSGYSIGTGNLKVNTESTFSNIIQTDPASVSPAEIYGKLTLTGIPHPDTSVDNTKLSDVDITVGSAGHLILGDENTAQATVAGNIIVTNAGLSIQNSNIQMTSGSYMPTASFDKSQITHSVTLENDSTLTIGGLDKTPHYSGSLVTNDLKLDNDTSILIIQGTLETNTLTLANVAKSEIHIGNANAETASLARFNINGDADLEAYTFNTTGAGDTNIHILNNGQLSVNGMLTMGGAIQLADEGDIFANGGISLSQESNHFQSGTLHLVGGTQSAKNSLTEGNFLQIGNPNGTRSTLNVAAESHWETSPEIILINGNLTVQGNMTAIDNINADNNATISVMAGGTLTIENELKVDTTMPQAPVELQVVDGGTLNIAGATVTANLVDFGTITLSADPSNQFTQTDTTTVLGTVNADTTTSLTLVGGEGGIFASGTVDALKVEIVTDVLTDPMASDLIAHANDIIILEGYKDIDEATLTDVTSYVNIPDENIGAGTLTYKGVVPDTGDSMPTTVAGIRGEAASTITGEGVHLVLTGQNTEDPSNDVGILSEGDIQTIEGATLTLGSSTASLAPTTSIGTDAGGYKNIVATGMGADGLQTSVIVQNTNLTGNNVTLSDNASLAINNASLTANELAVTNSTVSVGKDSNTASALTVSTLTLNDGVSHVSLASGTEATPLATLTVTGDADFGNAQFIADPQQQPTNTNSVYVGDYASLNVNGTFSHAGSSDTENPATLNMREGATLSAQGLSLGDGVTLSGGNIVLQDDRDNATPQSISGTLTVNNVNSSLTIAGGTWTTDSELTIQNGNLVVAGGTLDIGGKNDAGDTIEGGTLHFGSLSNTPQGAGDLTIASGATLDLTSDAVSGNLGIFGTVDPTTNTFTKDTEDLEDGSIILGNADTSLSLTYEGDHQEVTQEELDALKRNLATEVFGENIVDYANITIDGIGVFNTLNNAKDAEEGNFIGAGTYDPANSAAPEKNNLTFSEIVGDRATPETTNATITSGTLNLTGSGDGDARMLSVGAIDVQGGTLNLGYDARDNASATPPTPSATAGGTVNGILTVGNDGNTDTTATANIYGANVSIVGNAMINADGILRVKTGATLDVQGADGITLQGKKDTSGLEYHMLAQLIVEGDDDVANGKVATSNLAVNEYSTVTIATGAQLESTDISVNGPETILQTSGLITTNTLTIGAEGIATINNGGALNATEMTINANGSTYVKNDATLTVKTEEGNGMLSVVGDADTASHGSLSVEGHATTDTLTIGANGFVTVNGSTDEPLLTNATLTATNITMDGTTDAESLLTVGDSTSGSATIGAVNVSENITLKNESQLNVQNGTLSANTITANGNSVLLVGTEAITDLPMELEATQGAMGSEVKPIESIALHDNSLLGVDYGTVHTAHLTLADTALVSVGTESTHGNVVVDDGIRLDEQASIAIEQGSVSADYLELVSTGTGKLIIGTNSGAEDAILSSFIDRTGDPSHYQYKTSDFTADSNIDTGRIVIGDTGELQVSQTMYLNGGGSLDMYDDDASSKGGTIAAQGYAFDAPTTLAGGHLVMRNDNTEFSTQEIQGALTVDTAHATSTGGTKASVTIEQGGDWIANNRLTVTDGSLTVGDSASLNVEVGLTVGTDGTVNLGSDSSLTAALTDFGIIDLNKVESQQFTVNTENLAGTFSATSATLTLTGEGETQFVESIEELDLLLAEVSKDIFGDDSKVNINLNTVTVKAEDLSDVKTYYHTPEKTLAVGTLQTPGVAVTVGGLAENPNMPTQMDSVVSASDATLNLTGLGSAESVFTPGSLTIEQGTANLGWDGTSATDGGSISDSLIVEGVSTASADVTATANVLGKDVKVLSSVAIAQKGLVHVHRGSNLVVGSTDTTDGVSVEGQDSQLLIEGSMAAKKLEVGKDGIAIVRGGTDSTTGSTHVAVFEASATEGIQVDTGGSFIAGEYSTVITPTLTLANGATFFAGDQNGPTSVSITQSASLNDGTLGIDPGWSTDANGTIVDFESVNNASTLAIQSFVAGIDGNLVVGQNSLTALGTADTTLLAGHILNMEGQQGKDIWGSAGTTAALGIYRPQILASNGVLVVDGNATKDTIGTTTSGFVSASTGAEYNLPADNTAYFANKSLLVVDANGVGTAAALSSSTSGTLTVADGAHLHIVGGKAGDTVTITDGFNAQTSGKAASTIGNAWGYDDASQGSTADTVTLSSTLLEAEVQWNATDGIYQVTLASIAPEDTPYSAYASGSTMALISSLQEYEVKEDSPAGLLFASRLFSNVIQETIPETIDATAQLSTVASSSVTTLLDPKTAVATLEGAAQLAAVGNVNRNIMDAANTTASAVWSRNSFTGMNTSATQVSGLNVNRGRVTPYGGVNGGSLPPSRISEGTTVWAMPLYKWSTGTGFESGTMEHGYQNSMGGLAVGADYTYALDRQSAIRYGMALSVGAGVSESNGNFNTTTNGYDFWGLTGYAAYQNENFVGSFDIGVTSMSSRIDQNLPSSLAMGNLDTSVSSMVFTAGLNLEYTFVTEAVNITPHAGIRYMNVTTYDYDISSSAGLVGSSSQEDQGVWYFPVGVTLSKDFATGNGWVFTPKLDLGFIAAAGNMETNTSTSLTGVDQGLSYSMKNVDGFAFNGGLGFELYNKRNGVSFGLNYNVQASEHDTGHMIFANLRYEF